MPAAPRRPTPGQGRRSVDTQSHRAALREEGAGRQVRAQRAAQAAGPPRPAVAARGRREPAESQASDAGHGADAQGCWPRRAAARAGGPAAFKRGPDPSRAAAPRFEDVQKARKERVETDGRRVIEEPGNRVIVKQGDRTVIRHDEAERFRAGGRDVRSERRPDGHTETFFIRPDGVRIVSVTDGSGRLVRRYRRGPDGREYNIIDNRKFFATWRSALASARSGSRSSIWRRRGSRFRARCTSSTTTARPTTTSTKLSCAARR